MGSKKEFIYWKEVQKSDGSLARFPVYKKGKSFFVENDAGYEHLVHPSASSIDDEIRIVFKAKVIKTIMPRGN